MAVKIQEVQARKHLEEYAEEHVEFVEPSRPM